MRPAQLYYLPAVVRKRVILAQVPVVRELHALKESRAQRVCELDAPDFELAVRFAVALEGLLA